MKKNILAETTLGVSKYKDMLIIEWTQPKEFKGGYTGIVDKDAGVEIGANGNLYGARTQTKHSYASSRNAYTDKAESRGTVPVPFKDLAPSIRRRALAMKKWLDNQRILKKLAKEDYSSIDLKFAANGDCEVTPEQGKSFKVPEREYMAASVVAEEEEKAEDLGIEFGTIDGPNGQKKSVIKSVLFKGGQNRTYDWEDPNLPNFYRNVVRRVAAAIRKSENGNSIMQKINAKEDWKTVDVRVMSNGDAKINFDNGGTTTIKGAAASIVTESVNYFPY